MQCSCGGSTTSHEVVREKKVVGEFEQCTACGRVAWGRITRSLKLELEEDRRGRNSK